MKKMACEDHRKEETYMIGKSQVASVTVPKEINEEFTKILNF